MLTPVEVTVYPFLMMFKRPATTSRGALTSRQSVFVRVADIQRVGWGEAAPVPGLSIDGQPDFVAAVRQVCAELSTRGLPPPTSAADVEAILHSPSDAAGRASASSLLPGAMNSLPSLVFALETALLDLASGGQQVLFDTRFSRGEDVLPIHGLIWMDTPRAILEQVERKMQQGCRVIKMKVGALPFDEELGLLRELRRRWPVGDVELRLDANGAWQPTEALECLQQLEELDVAFLEQPVTSGQWPVMADLCQRSPVSIALDEELIGVPASKRRALLETIQPQHLILKPTLLGGLAACETWIEEASKLNIGWWVNSMLESNVGLNAIAQWTATHDVHRVHGLGTGQLFTNNVPAPLRLEGCGLRIDGAARWNFTAIEDVDG